MKVLLVANHNTNSGGGERHVGDLILHAQDVEYSLACPTGYHFEHLCRAADISYFPISSGRSLGPTAAIKLRRAITKSRPEVVHAHGTRAAVHAAVATAFMDIPLVYTLHGIHLDKGRRFLLKLWIARAICSKVSQFITVCEADLATGTALRILEPKRTTVVYNGVAVPATNTEFPVRTREQRRSLGFVKGETIVLSVGRLSREKNQEGLIRAFARAHNAMRSAVLVIIAAGPETGRDQLRCLVEAYRIDESVRILAPRDDLARLYPAVDIFALSSLWEGLPYVVLDAASFGIPVVSTAVGGIPEIFGQSDAVLVPPADDIALSRALESLVAASDEHRQMIGASCRDAVAHGCRLDKMVRLVVSIYCGALEISE